MECQRPAFDRAKRFVKIPQPTARSDALDRNAPEAPAKFDEDAVLEIVERREVDVTALGLDDVVSVSFLQQRCHTEARAWTNDADDAGVGQWPVGSTQVLEMLPREGCDRISN